MEEDKEEELYYHRYHYLADERHVQLFDTDKKRVLDGGSCLDIRRCGYGLVHVTKKWHRFSSCLDDGSHTHLEEVVEGHTIPEGCS